MKSSPKPKRNSHNEWWWYTSWNNNIEYTIWLFNIAMENPNHEWRFLAWKIIYEWAIYTMAMLNNQRVTNNLSSTNKIHRVLHP